MQVDVLTTFPDYLAPLTLSLVGRARRAGLIDVRVHDLRDWALDRHRSTDDAPYGGGAGMVMRPDVWGRALDFVAAAPPDETTRASGEPRLLIPSPSGRLFSQSWAVELAGEAWLVFACGRFEGIDARVAEAAAATWRVEEFSLGDYVLNGGEVAALAAIEAVTRLVPGVLGNPESLSEESHVDGLLEYPLYTRPPVWRGLAVPEVLRSGDHARIARWRRDESLRRTAQRRPDLLDALSVASCDSHDLLILAELGWAVRPGGGFWRATGPLAD